MAAELVNLPGLSSNLELTSHLNDLPHDFVNPTVMYNLKQPIRSSIIIIKNLPNIDIENFLIESSSVACCCKDLMGLQRDLAYTNLASFSF